MYSILENGKNGVGIQLTILPHVSILGSPGRTMKGSDEIS